MQEISCDDVTAVRKYLTKPGRKGLFCLKFKGVVHHGGQGCRLRCIHREAERHGAGAARTQGKSTALGTPRHVSSVTLDRAEANFHSGFPQHIPRLDRSEALTVARWVVPLTRHHLKQPFFSPRAPSEVRSSLTLAVLETLFILTHLTVVTSGGR